MPNWILKPSWDGHEAFIIGGGDSLRNFNWDLLKPFRTIGCNDAYKLGVEVCKVCFFADREWYDVHKDELKKFEGTVFTNSPQLRWLNIPDVWQYPLKKFGLHTDAIGYNSNSGACAINLAILLGVKTIWLLGFDMKLKNGIANWHPNLINDPTEEVYPKFLEGFNYVVRDLEKFPGVDVINVTDDSDLNVFPKIGTEEFWKGRIK